MADHALRLWETGATEEHRDSTGAVWVFVQERESELGLGITRTLPDPEAAPVTSFVTQRDLGTENARTLLASRILALSEPV